MRALLLLSLLVAVSYASKKVRIAQTWTNGYKSVPCILVTKQSHGWKVKLDFSGSVSGIDQYVGKASGGGNTWYVSNSGENKKVGDKICFVAVISGGGNNPSAKISVVGQSDPSKECTCGDDTTGSFGTGSGVISGGGGGGGGGSTSGNSKMGKGCGKPTKNYKEALTNSVSFYLEQMSGNLNGVKNLPSWKKSSATSDCVEGGWYDAGDHLKFSLPMASSVNNLMWSYVDYPDAYGKTNQKDRFMESAKWVLDYFLRGWDAKSQKLIAQVGDGGADHSFWGCPEDMHMARPCQYISPSKPGGSIAGEVASSFALGSMVFKSNKAYSANLLSNAKKVYDFATKHSGLFYGSSPFYTPSSSDDELCVAGVWLKRATGDNSYLTKAKAHAKTKVPWAYSWDDKSLACQILMYQETKDSQYKSAVEGFFKSWLPGSGMAYTPCGLAWRDTWGSNRYAADAAAMALAAYKSGIMTDKLGNWAAEQINYLLGDNKHAGGCYSFEIGYGTSFPQHPHHRCASTKKVELTGALVGGPGKNDDYADVQTDYTKNEVATDYNSGFQYAVAALQHLSTTKCFPATNNVCKCAKKG